MLPDTFDAKALMAFAQDDRTQVVRESFSDAFMELADKPTGDELHQAEQALFDFLPNTDEAFTAFRNYESAHWGRASLYADLEFALGFWLALHPWAIIETIEPFWDAFFKLQEMRAKAMAEAEAA